MTEAKDNRRRLSPFSSPFLGRNSICQGGDQTERETERPREAGEGGAQERIVFGNGRGRPAGVSTSSALRQFCADLQLGTEEQEIKHQPTRRRSTVMTGHAVLCHVMSCQDDLGFGAGKKRKEKFLRTRGLRAQTAAATHVQSVRKVTRGRP